jgi:hypothetical protein
LRGAVDDRVECQEAAEEAVGETTWEIFLQVTPALDDTSSREISG